jgi:hypothetical protein
VGEWGSPAFFSQYAPVTDAPGLPLAYNATVPVQLQYRDWSCSIVSTHWALSSLGYDVDRETLVAIMTPWPVGVNVGLLDASGAGLAQFLRDEYGVPAHSTSVASWTEVTAAAGRYPVMIGGRGWNHWTAVRKTVAGALALANPAPGYRKIYQSLSHGQFESWLGSFAMVEIPV